MKNLLYILVLFFATTYCKAQNFDSLVSIHNYIKNKESKKKNYQIIRTENSLNNLQTSSLYKLIDIAQQEKDDTTVGVCYAAIGIRFFPSGDYNNSLIFLNKAIKILETLKVESFTDFINKEMGGVYARLKNYDEAIKYYKKAIEIRKEINKKEGNYYLLFNYYLGLAKIYIEIDKLDSAELYTQKAIVEKHYWYNEDTLKKYYSISDILHIKFRENFVLAFLNLKKKDTAIAKVYFEKVFAIAADSLVPQLLHRYCETAIEYAKIQTTKNNELHYYLLAYNIAREKDLKQPLIDAAKELSDFYFKENQKDSSLFYLRISVAYNDSINNAKAASELQNTTALLHIEQKEKDETLLKEQENRKHNLQFAAISIFLVTILILFFVFSHTVIVSQKFIDIIGTIVLLLVFEFINLFIHPYLGHWLHENAFLMLLALVCIAAIIVPVHHKIEHYIKGKLIEKNKKIRLRNARKTVEELDKKL